MLAKLDLNHLGGGLALPIPGVLSKLHQIDFVFG